MARLALLFAIGLLDHALAATAVASPFAFQWGFQSSDEVAECANMSLFAENEDASVVPPFKLIGVVPGRVPVTSTVGSDTSSLTWVVNVPAGSELMLSMVDSNGSFGGAKAPGFVTQSAPALSCRTESDGASKFTVTSNATALSTCDLVEFSITGGLAPYYLQLIISDTGTSLNVTLGPKDDTFTWVNRAPPGHQIIAYAQDGAGNLSRATKLLSTSGSSNATCPGLNDVAYNSLDGMGAKRVIARKDVSAIIGFSIAACVLLVLSLVGLLYYRKTRSKRLSPPIPIDLAGDSMGSDRAAPIQVHLASFSGESDIEAHPVDQHVEWLRKGEVLESPGIPTPPCLVPGNRPQTPGSPKPPRRPGRETNAWAPPSPTLFTNTRQSQEMSLARPRSDRGPVVHETQSWRQSDSFDADVQFPNPHPRMEQSVHAVNVPSEGSRVDKPPLPRTRMVISNQVSGDGQLHDFHDRKAGGVVEEAASMANRNDLFEPDKEEAPPAYGVKS